MATPQWSVYLQTTFIGVLMEQEIEGVVYEKVEDHIPYNERSSYPVKDLNSLVFAVLD